MSFNSWNQQQIEKLIQEYQQHPILYCTSNKHYRNRKLRAVAVKEILKEVQKVRPGTCEVDILNEISMLRQNYFKERRKQQRSITASSSQIYQPSAWYHDSLGFLNDHITREKSKNEFSMEDLQMELFDESAFEVADFHSMSIANTLSEAETENEIKNCLKKKKDDGDKLLAERKQQYSSDCDDNVWLCYLSTLITQIKDTQKRVLLRHKITKLLYTEIEKQFCDDNT